MDGPRDPPRADEADSALHRMADTQPPLLNSRCLYAVASRRPDPCDGEGGGGARAVSLPSIESLRCFIAAAESLNFRAASKAVGLTPAALGQRVRQLEDELGHPLFTRTTRQVSLTAAGLAMLPVARRTLSAAG